jgi:hypothetical protein
MAHDVDGFEFKYVGRTWKAEDHTLLGKGSL